ncbi:VWA domain-containing protein [Pseudahrensia aquimaris]|uniref:VWA domain-containing protein n=1 Tax=Pseudahrensia aquimaris TaxID=744461 RepID=A0ABW3FEK5_9HYPH
MSDIRNSTMPRAAQAFVEFAQVLRQNGFAVAPEQTAAFIEAIELLGPRGLEDIRNAGIAMLSIPRARWGEYDGLFRAFFMGQTISAPATSEDDDEGVEAFEPRDGERDVEIDTEDSEIGTEATRAETLTQRSFSQLGEAEALRQFARHAPSRLPRRFSFRRRKSRHGDRPDVRRAMREAVRRDGELFELPKTTRKMRQRPITLLIDVSGSMAEQSEGTMRLAHAVVQTADRAEVFTLGTRLTRITPALRHRNAERALEQVAGVVADFDGGTRIGDALVALLAVPRFASSLRGASVVIVSDGLERGDAQAMVDCMARIDRMAWRVEWLSPLAADPDYEPRTEALSASLRYIDNLADGSTVAAIASHILMLASPSRFRRRFGRAA